MIGMSDGTWKGGLRKADRLSRFSVCPYADVFVLFVYGNVRFVYPV